MKTTSDIRNADLIRRIAITTQSFGDVDVMVIKKMGKYAYYVTTGSKKIACFALCSDKEEDILKLYQDGVFKKSELNCLKEDKK